MIFIVYDVLSGSVKRVYYHQQDVVVGLYEAVKKVMTLPTKNLNLLVVKGGMLKSRMQ